MTDTIDARDAAFRELARLFWEHLERLDPQYDNGWEGLTPFEREVYMKATRYVLTARRDLVAKSLASYDKEAGRANVAE